MVEGDAERRQVLALIGEHRVQREPMHALPAVPQRPFREIDQPVDLRVRIGQHAGEIRLSRQVFIREARSNVAHIVAPVTFLRKGDIHVAGLPLHYSLPCSSTCRMPSSLASGLTRILRKPAPATVSGSNRPVAASAGALALAISSAICRGLRRRRLESWSAMLLA